MHCWITAAFTVVLSGELSGESNSSLDLYFRFYANLGNNCYSMTIKIHIFIKHGLLINKFLEI